MNNDQIRFYTRSESIVFLKTKEEYGGLSNMCSGYSLCVNNIIIRTSEALYQACRFPHLPEVQGKIIGSLSPMTAKMVSKPFRDKTRSDWYSVRMNVMRWCLRIKLIQNWNKFSSLLRSTGDLPIVEESRKDDYWGAKPVGENSLVGMNILGRLLMELRRDIFNNKIVDGDTVPPLMIPEFKLNGLEIGPVFFQDSFGRNIVSDGKQVAKMRYEIFNNSNNSGEMSGSNIIDKNSMGNSVGDIQTFLVRILKNPMSLSDLCELTNIPNSELKCILNLLVKNGNIIKENRKDLYRAASEIHKGLPFGSIILNKNQ
jgi:ribA/ribD-fused uncharacterized protein